MNNSREKILDRIREASKIESALPSMPKNADVILEQKIMVRIPQTGDELLNQFKNELKALSAEFFLSENLTKVPSLIYKMLKDNNYKKFAVSESTDCQSVAKKIKEIDPSISFILATELKDRHRKEELAKIPVALVKASFAVADIGSLVFPYDENGTSLPHFLADCVFALVERRQLLSNQFELFKKIDIEKSKNMVFMAGPSRTADIEKVLVLGAHGPRCLVVIMVDQ